MFKTGDIVEWHENHEHAQKEFESEIRRELINGGNWVHHYYGIGICLWIHDHFGNTYGDRWYEVLVGPYGRTEIKLFTKDELVKLGEL
jgi:hypothetical protein